MKYSYIPAYLYNPPPKSPSRRDKRRTSRVDRIEAGKKKLAVFQTARKACV